MKSFSEFHNSRNNRFAWGDDDLEHHDSVIKEDLLVEKVEKKIPPEINQFSQHKLDRKHVTALKSYKDKSDINEPLRKNKGLYSDEHQHVKYMDHVTSFKLKEPLTVYRGAYGHHSASAKKFKQKGHEFTDHGFTSTSLKKEVARTFSSRGKKSHIFAIHLKPGDKGYHLDRHKNYHEKEHEVLLHRGTRFKVTHHSEDDKNHITHLSVVSQEARPLKQRNSWW